MLQECVLVRVMRRVGVVVASRARRAEHGRRRDGPDVGDSYRRLRQVGQHQLLVARTAATVANLTVAAH